MKPEAREIAVLDDDPMLVESLRDVQESTGHKVCFFSSGDEFLEDDRFKKIACLITDIDMPVMDGFGLWKLTHARRPELPVIFMTGKSEIAEQERFFNFSGGAFFSKTF